MITTGFEGETAPTTASGFGKGALLIATGLEGETAPTTASGFGNGVLLIATGFEGEEEKVEGWSLNG